MTGTEGKSKPFPPERRSPVLVSACLLGVRCRYDGGHSLCRGAAEFAGRAAVIPFCPEQLGGLPTPRPPANLFGGDGRDVLRGVARLRNTDGRDVTAAFEKGAREALKLARLTGARTAIMKDRSPSCGLRTPYCDRPEGHGIGVTAALFESNGIRVYESGTEDPFPPEGFPDGREGGAPEKKGRNKGGLPVPRREA